MFAAQSHLYCKVTWTTWLVEESEARDVNVQARRLGRGSRAGLQAPLKNRCLSCRHPAAASRDALQNKLPDWKLSPRDKLQYDEFA
jgi:hypothetical protein